MTPNIKRIEQPTIRVWHIPQIPHAGFFWSVSSIEEGKMVCDLLGRYDLFQFENNIKPDYSNANGIEVFEDGEWTDWECSRLFEESEAQS